MELHYINRIWDEEKITDDKIVNHLKETLVYANKQLRFYKTRRKKRRWWANSILIFSILLFTSSLLFPILTGPDDNILKTEINYYAISYLFLVLASILLFIDRFFGHSDAWMRYVLTEMQLNKTISEYHGRWIKLIQSLELNILTPENKNNLIDLLQEFDKALREIVITETETWKGLLTQRINDYSKRLNNKLEESTKKLSKYKEEIEKKLKKNADEEKIKHLKGILSIRLKKNENSKTRVTIKGPNTNETKKLESYMYSVTYMDLKLGNYLIKVEEAIDNKIKKEIEKIVAIV